MIARGKAALFFDRTCRPGPDRGATFVTGADGPILLHAVARYPDVREVVAASKGCLHRKLTIGHWIGSVRGTVTLDASYAAYQQHIDDLLVSMGWRCGTDFQNITCVNSGRDETAWRAP